MTLETKSRSNIQIFPRQFEYSFDKGKNWTKEQRQKVSMGGQITDSEGHSKLKNGAWSGGGPFHSVRVERDFPTVPINFVEANNGSNRLRAEVGTILQNSQLPAIYQNMTPQAFKKANQGNLDALGATAIALSAPTNPNAELSVAIGELYKDGLPALPGVRTWKRRTEIVRAAASEYLNAQFGWLPLVNDVKNTARSVAHSRDILKQYHKDSGNNVRREFSFPVTESDSIGFSEQLSLPTVIQQGTTGFPSFLNSTIGYGPIGLTQSIRTRTRRWFSGAFTYTVPSQSDSWHKAMGYGSDADKLLGTTLTPDVLWELTPWSWAVDWFTNTGDVIHNVSNFALQGLIMRYGYMMEESTIEVTHSFTGKRDKTNSAWGAIPPSKFIMTSKRRRAANPFGFGVTMSGLSATQVAIAAALGITLL